MTLDLGPMNYIALLWIIGSVTLAVAALALRKQIHISGFVAWFIYLAAGPAGLVLAYPIAQLTGLDQYLLPMAAIGWAISVPIIHSVVPNLAKDFQTDGLGTSMLMGFLLSCSLVGAATATRLATQMMP